MSATVELDGGRKFRKALKSAGFDMKDLRKPYAEASKIVASAGKRTAPRGKTGKLAGSVRPGATRTMGVVRAGSKAVPYANPIHWGWPRRNIKPQPWLSHAAQNTEPAWLQEFWREMDRIMGTMDEDYR